MNKLKISGFIHAQYMNAAQNGLSTYSGHNFGPATHSAFKLRRARLNFEYKSGIAG